MIFISDLNKLPDGLGATEKLITDFDDCFLVGFANLESKHEETLESLKRIFSGTPLEKKLNEAITGILSNEFLDNNFVTLAVVRASLQGCIYDVLKQQVNDSLRRKTIPQVSSINNNHENNQNLNKVEEFPPHLQSLMLGIRHWLMEIALAGYSRLETSAIVPFSSSLEKIQQDPLLIRQSAFLTGFFNELMRQLPLKESNPIPLYRWVDLWTRAMIGAVSPSLDSQSVTQGIKVSGNLELLGLDIRQHQNLVSLVFYGIFEGDNLKQMVRVNFSAYKVDVINNNDIWLLFPQAFPLLGAMSKENTLTINNMPLLPTGDILWTGEADSGVNIYSVMKKAADNFAIGVDGIANCLIQATDKHPIQIAEPVYLDTYKIEGDGDNLKLIWQDGGELNLAKERLSLLSEITPEVIKKSSQMFGLLRFDAGCWSIQPLSILVRGKTMLTINFTSEKEKNYCKNNPLAILQERASKLLRTKA
jgi:hypothetical protein